MTIRHFFADLQESIDALPDTRLQELVVYPPRFLITWGLLLFCCKLGSRRQLDFELREHASEVLSNVNRLAKTDQQTLPVDGTLDHYLSHLGYESLESLRDSAMERLIRMKALDGARLMGRIVVAADGTWWLAFRHAHCHRCLWQKQGNKTLYFHPVLEFKLLGPRGMALSINTAFIENTGPVEEGELRTGDEAKQDCELKALARGAASLRKKYPQTRFCLTSDSLAGCGTAMQIAKDNRMDFIYVFKEGRLPSVWREFQQLASMCPQNRLHISLPNGGTQDYRWVEGLTHTDTAGRHHVFNALECIETVDGVTTRFAWMTILPVSEKTVAEIAQKGGRARWCIENQGFNIQKNSDLNLTHAYSEDLNRMKAYYLLLQIAHIILQLVENGSLLANHARRQGKSVHLLFGSLKNIARRLTEAIRNVHLPDDAFDPGYAASIQIRFGTA